MPEPARVYIYATPRATSSTSSRRLPMKRSSGSTAGLDGQLSYAKRTNGVRA